MKYNQLRLVMTGSRCNLNCAYCIAGYSGVKPSLASGRIEEEKIWETICPHEFSSISLWGGEPFFNFEILQQTVDFCQRRLPELPIGIISNGTAFSREKMDYIKKNKLHIILSHDAWQQSYRSSDFLQNSQQRDMINEIENLGFSTVIHNFNCDFAAIFRYFETVEKALDRPFGWGFELFELSSAAAIQFLPQGKHLVQFGNSIDFLLQQFVAGHPFAISALQRILLGMASVIDGDRVVSARCGADKRLTVTTEGKIAFCQVQAENGKFDVPDLSLPVMCSNCEVARFCAGICPNLTDGYRKKMCVIYKLFYSKLYEFLMHLRLTEHSADLPKGIPEWQISETIADEAK